LYVFGIPRGPDGGGYYRLYLPLRHMEKHGHTVTLPPVQMKAMWLPDWDVLAGKVDVLVGQTITFKHGMDLWEEAAGHTRLVYELDDNVFAVHPDNPVRAVWEKPGTREVAAYCMSMADLVTCSTEPLAEQLRQYNPNVIVLPNSINADQLTLERPRRDHVVVGWAGSPSHSEDLKGIAGSVRSVLTQHPGVELHLIGTDYLSLFGRRDGRFTGRFTAWQDDIWDYYRTIDFDIGLAPLAPTGFNAARSHIKALELAALGIPVIASDAEAYREFVVDGVTGFLVRTQSEWKRRLRELVNDVAMRTEMGAKARQVAADWTIQERWPAWERAYADLMAI
jgi:glycosyltransferase involved in cell wall biosynthesis